MLKEIRSKALPKQLRRFKCTICGKTLYARNTKDIELECCGWVASGKGTDKFLKEERITTYV